VIIDALSCIAVIFFIFVIQIKGKANKHSPETMQSSMERWSDLVV